MVTDALGDQVFPKRLSYGNQPVWEFENQYVFVLQNDVYRKAGLFHWKPAYDRGELCREGISFNKRVFAKMVNSDKEFVIFDKARSRVLRYSNLDAISDARESSQEMFDNGNKSSYKLTEERYGTTLVVVPLDAFSKESYEEVPEEIKKRY